MSLQLAEIYQSETDASCIDSLTGLFTHGFFQLLLDHEINRSNRYGSCFTIGFIDIDGFEQYNQQNGSLKGDQMLKDIAMLIRDSIRKVDLAARYGGDIFVVVFPETGTDAAGSALGRILTQVETLSDKKLTACAGFALFPADAKTKNRILLKAIEALREAKLRGRNRSFFFRSESNCIKQDAPEVLVVDDEPRNVKLLSSLLSINQYKVFQAFNGIEAIKILENTDIDLIFMDVMMPVMNGFEACRIIKNKPETRMIPVIMLTALDDSDSKIKGIEAGADDFITKPPKKMEILARCKSLIKVKKLNRNLTSIENVLFSLANAVETKDPYTEGHIQRVANLAASLGRRMGFSHARIDALRFGGILHDIGKIGIPRTILNKAGTLSDKEWEIMMTHPDMGYKICLPLEKTLGSALKAIRHHHEKLDGSGYPDGLQDDSISIEARIMAVADIYDALTTNRRYRKAMTSAAALDILNTEVASSKIDGNVVKELTEIIASEEI